MNAGCVDPYGSHPFNLRAVLLQFSSSPKAFDNLLVHGHHHRILLFDGPPGEPEVSAQSHKLIRLSLGHMLLNSLGQGAIFLELVFRHHKINA
jgi:hypothetical protein